MDPWEGIPVKIEVITVPKIEVRVSIRNCKDVVNLKISLKQMFAISLFPAFFRETASILNVFVF